MKRPETQKKLNDIAKSERNFFWLLIALAIVVASILALIVFPTIDDGTASGTVTWSEKTLSSKGRWGARFEVKLEDGQLVYVASSPHAPPPIGARIVLHSRRNILGIRSYDWLSDQPALTTAPPAL